MSCEDPWEQLLDQLAESPEAGLRAWSALRSDAEPLEVSARAVLELAGYLSGTASPADWASACLARALDGPVAVSSAAMAALHAALRGHGALCSAQGDLVDVFLADLTTSLWDRVSEEWAHVEDLDVRFAGKSLALSFDGAGEVSRIDLGERLVEEQAPWLLANDLLDQLDIEPVSVAEAVEARAEAALDGMIESLRDQLAATGDLFDELRFAIALEESEDADYAPGRAGRPDVWLTVSRDEARLWSGPLAMHEDDPLVFERDELLFVLREAIDGAESCD